MIIFRLISIFFTFVLILIPSIVDADIQRSCNAYYQIKIHSINGRVENRDSSKILPFYARRGCGNRVPNKCRRRARDAAQHCMKLHWINRALRIRIGECTASFGVHNYNIVDIQREIEQSICLNFSITKNDMVVFSLYGITEGDTGCGPHLDKRKATLIQKNYTLRCTIDNKR